MEKHPNYQVELYEKNKDIIQDRNRRRYKEDINYRLTQIIRINILRAVKDNKKSNFSKKLLGCTIEEFKLYIESLFLPEMNWGNHGVVWELDHIIGCCNFNLEYDKEQEICFHFSNLQPLFKTTKIAESFGYKDYIGNRNKTKYKLDE